MSRTIGLIGGMAWESSAEYYRLINQEVRRRLGGYHSAQSLLLSVDFAEIEQLQRDDDWAEAGRRLATAARTLETAGAGLVVLCTNTMHKVAAEVEAAVDIPFIHIVDVTAEAIRDAGLSTVGLLGTRYTMEMDFYRERMRGKGVETLVPDATDRGLVHDVIFDELVHHHVEDASRARYRAVVDKLAERGAQGVILGCTEITLLIGPNDCAVPVFDSTALHAAKAVDLALA